MLRQRMLNGMPVVPDMTGKIPAQGRVPLPVVHPGGGDPMEGGKGAGGMGGGGPFPMLQNRIARTQERLNTGIGMFGQQLGANRMAQLQARLPRLQARMTNRMAGIPGVHQPLELGGQTEPELLRRF